MFDKLKDLAAMRSQANQIQAQLATIIVTKERHGINVKVNGNQEMLEMILPDDKSAMTGDALKRLINEALEAAKKEAARVMQGLLQ